METISASDAKREFVQRKALQQAIDEGIADIKAGRVVDGEEVFASIRKQVLDAEL